VFEFRTNLMIGYKILQESHFCSRITAEVAEEKEEEGNRPEKGKDDKYNQIKLTKKQKDKH